MEIRIKQAMYDVLLPIKNISDVNCEDSRSWILHLASGEEFVVEGRSPISEIIETLNAAKDFLTIQQGDYIINCRQYVEDGIDDSDPNCWEVEFESGNAFSLEDDDLEAFVKLSGIPCEDVAA